MQHRGTRKEKPEDARGGTPKPAPMCERKWGDGAKRWKGMGCGMLAEGQKTEREREREREKERERERRKEQERERTADPLGGHGV